MSVLTQSSSGHVQLPQKPVRKKQKLVTTAPSVACKVHVLLQSRESWASLVQQKLIKLNQRLGPAVSKGRLAI